MSKQAYEYEVTIIGKSGKTGTSGILDDPKQAGNWYRNCKRSIATEGGGSTELKRRPVAPWETVESTKV